MFQTLAEYRDAIESAVATSAVCPRKSRNRLRELSVAIRRQLWRDRVSARNLADAADVAASNIERDNNWLPTSPMPRFDGLCSGGKWHPPVS